MQLDEQNTSAQLLQLFDKFITCDALCEVSLEREEDEDAWALLEHQPSVWSKCKCVSVSV